MTRILGLTGGIATGKSTVARMLARRGAVVVDADAIVHELEKPGTPVFDAIVAAFGREVLDARGELDREALGARVFRDPEARQRLNAIVHPAVAAEMARRVEAARRAGAPLVVLDIPLLLESGDDPRALARRLGLDAIVVVYAPEALQIERQVEREGYDRAEAERRVRAQRPIEEKRALGDYVIDNSGALAETEAQVERLLEIVAAEPGGPAC